MGNYPNYMDKCCGEDTRPPSMLRQPNEELIFDHCLQQLCTKGKMLREVAKFIKEDFFGKQKEWTTYDNKFFFYFKKRKMYYGQFLSRKREDKIVMQGNNCQVSCYDKNKFFWGSFQDQLPCKGRLTLDFTQNMRNQPINHVLQFNGEWRKGVGSTSSFIIKEICGKIRIDNSENIITDVRFTTQMLDNCFFIQYPNLDVYAGQVEYAQMPNKVLVAHGFGRYVYRNKTANNYPYYQGLFRFGVRHGHGIMHMSEQKSLQIGWVNGKPHGAGRYTVNSTMYPVYYSHGVRIENQASAIP